MDNEVFAPPPGYLTRPLDQAKNALANEDYPNAIESLAVLFGLDSIDIQLAEDYFLPTKRKFATRSIRREALKLVANMPSRGRAVFELKYGIAAEKRLSEAIQTNDSAKLLDVSLKYFHTKAGYVATYLLGREKLFQGDFQIASRFLDKLDQHESARELLDPELTILSSVASAGSGRNEKAISKLMTLKDVQPNLQFIWGEEVRTHTIVDAESTADFLKDLLKAFPKIDSVQRVGAATAEREWLSLRSNLNLLQGDADSILPIPAWTLNTVYGEKKLKTFRDATRTRIQSKAPAFLSSHAIALKNTVVFRTADRVYAVDLKTGKRTWMYPWSHQRSISSLEEDKPDSDKRVNRDLWSNAINSRITSDGEKIYFVQSSDLEVDGRFPNSSLMQGRPILDPRNSLVALKVVDEQGFSVEGQLAWKIDTRNDDPELSGAIFLGPPLLKNGIAYVLYERSGQVRVAALDSATGQVNWSQQIASTQSYDGYDQRVFRYQSASSPVFANGLLICPTMVGGLVAIDLTDRSLKWGFKYDALNESRYIQGFDSTSSFSPWYDDALFVLDEYICFSPVDSRNYYLIRIETGKTKTVRPKEKHWFVAGKFNETLVLVGPEALTLDPLSGFTGAKIEYSEFGKPVGTGLFSGNHLYLPFTDNKLLRIDLEKKQIGEVIETSVQAGNLSQYGGRLLSRSATGIQSYWLKKAAMANMASKSDPSDASKWLVQAQVLADEQKTGKAIESLIRSIQLTSTAMSEAYLAKLLIENINRGSSIDWQLMQRGFDLLKNPRHKRSYLLAKIESRFAVGQGSQAINDLVALIDLYGPSFRGSKDGGNDALISVSQDHWIAGLRLVRSRLRNALASLPEAGKEELVAKLENRFDKAIESGQLDAIRTYAEIFGELDFISKRAGELATVVLSSGRPSDLIWLNAMFHELLFPPSSNRKNAKRQLSESTVLELINGMTRLKARIHQSKDVYSKELLRKSLDTLDALNALKQSANQVAKATDELIDSLRLKLGSPLKIRYADGMTRIDVFEDSELDILFVDAQERRHPSFLQHSNRLNPLNFRVEFDERGYFLVRDRFGKLVFQGDSRTRGSRHSNRRYDQSQYQILGDLLILSCGFDHVALDLSRVASLQPGQLPTDESDLLVGETDYDVAILWRFNSFQAGRTRGTTRMRRESNSLGIVAKELFDSNGARVCKPGFLSSSGYCFLSGETVYCLNPWSGQVLWKRTGFKPGSDLSSDESNIYAISSDDRKVNVLSRLDGTDVKTLDVPANMINRFSLQGSLVHSIREDDKSIIVYGFQIRSESIDLAWTKRLPKGSKANLVNRESLAVLTPEGRFQMIDLESGKASIAFQVDLSDIKLSSIQVFEFGHQMMLVANRNSNSNIESKRLEIGERFRPVVNVDGSVILFGKSGPQWASPARMDGYDLVLNQPAETPAFMFKRRDTDAQTTELVFVRRTDGSLISYDNPMSYTGVTTNIRYLADRKSLTFNLGYQWMALKMTKHPRPPEPPAQTGKYSSIPDRPNRKPKRKPVDPFAESNGDIFQSSNKTIQKWVDEEWKNNPMNPNRPGNKSSESSPMNSSM